MSEIQRYSIDREGVDYADDAGPWVTHSDHLADLDAKAAADAEKIRTLEAKADWLDDFSARAHEWQLATFPTATVQSKANHLHREAIELLSNPTDPEEMADIFLLLIDIAKVTNTDLRAAVEAKLAKNKARKWGKPDAAGVVEHIRDSLSSTTPKEPNPMTTDNHAKARADAKFQLCNAAFNIASEVDGPNNPIHYRLRATIIAAAETYAAALLAAKQAVDLTDYRIGFSVGFAAGQHEAESKPSAWAAVVGVGDVLHG